YITAARLGLSLNPSMRKLIGIVTSMVSPAFQERWSATQLPGVPTEDCFSPLTKMAKPSVAHDGCRTFSVNSVGLSQVKESFVAPWSGKRVSCLRETPFSFQWSAEGTNRLTYRPLLPSL